MRFYCFRTEPVAYEPVHPVILQQRDDKKASESRYQQRNAAALHSDGQAQKYTELASSINNDLRLSFFSSCGHFCLFSLSGSRG